MCEETAEEEAVDEKAATDDNTVLEVCFFVAELEAEKDDEVEPSLIEDAPFDVGIAEETVGDQETMLEPRLKEDLFITELADKGVVLLDIAEIELDITLELETTIVVEKAPLGDVFSELVVLEGAKDALVVNGS